MAGMAALITYVSPPPPIPPPIPHAHASVVSAEWRKGGNLNIYVLSE